PRPAPQSRENATVASVPDARRPVCAAGGRHHRDLSPRVLRGLVLRAVRPPADPAGGDERRSPPGPRGPRQGRLVTWGRAGGGPYPPQRSGRPGEAVAPL